MTYEEEELIKLHDALSLQIELVPQSSWCLNVRKILKVSQWNKIRKSTYIRANNKCEICGWASGNRHPDCHEVWTYDTEVMTQRLASFQAICSACHEVKHLGRAIIRGNGDAAYNRFRTFNKLDQLTALKIKNAVFKLWQLRSTSKWALDIGLLKDFDIDIEELPL